MRWNKKSVVMWLAGINIAIFILQQIIPNFTEYFFLYSPDVMTRPWILLTHMFLHAGLAHLLFNLYALIVFGGLLEQKIGSKRFTFVYFVSGITAGFVASFFYTASLGASGAIMGALAALIVLMPDLRVLFFFAIPMPFWVAGVVWIALDVMGVFFPSGVGNIAHLVGTLTGFIYGFWLIRQKRNFGKNSSFSTTTHLSAKDIEDYFSRGRI